MKHDVVEMREHSIVLDVPKEAYKLEIIATTYDEDDKLVRMSKMLRIQDIHAGRLKYLELDPDDGIRYVLTDKAKAYLQDDEGMSWEEYLDAHSDEGE